MLIKNMVGSLVHVSLKLIPETPYKPNQNTNNAKCPPKLTSFFPEQCILIFLNYFFILKLKLCSLFHLTVLNCFKTIT